MLTPEQLATIRSQLAAITQGKWTVSPSPLADSRYMGFVCDCAQSHRDNSHQFVISDEHYNDAADDARFIAEAPATIKLLLDEVERLQLEVERLKEFETIPLPPQALPVLDLDELDELLDEDQPC